MSDVNAELLAVSKEILDRTRRMESRMVQLGDHVGANLRSKQKIEIKPDPAGGVMVVIDSLDVSMSRIVTELKQHGLSEEQLGVDIYLPGSDEMIATLYVPK
ncbi:hypothetical protein [Burkholderia cenocepacia]|uniref:hypothetical protein n=1 Tax=Burkholderia cenocepacia TaxID=95486 RepID=UPI002ABDA6CE|nr:hypothetical protein [Burkholderia cenocepacia]